MKNMPQFQKIEDKKEWQGLLNKVLFKTFFHTLEWESFLEDNFKWLKFERYLYEDKAILSSARYKIFGKEKLISHPFCEYGGPLLLKKGVDFQRFQDDLFSEFKIPIKIKIHPHLFRCFNSPRTVLELLKSEGNTYFIEDLRRKTKEQIWFSFRKTLRHSIKKAQNQGIEIKRCEKEKELENFHELYVKGAKKHKTLAYPFSFFQYFLRSQASEIILAKYNDKIMAGSVFLFHEDFVHYFLNASDEKYKDLNANHLILWNQIKNYCGKNYQVFDFGGTREGSELEIFKSGWGGTKKPILELTNQSAEKGFRESKLRGIFGLLPPILIKKISLHLLKYKL